MSHFALTTFPESHGANQLSNRILLLVLILIILDGKFKKFIIILF